MKSIDVSGRTARSGSGTPSQGVLLVEGVLVCGNHCPSRVGDESRLGRAERRSETCKGDGLEVEEATERQRFGWTVGTMGREISGVRRLARQSGVFRVNGTVHRGVVELRFEGKTGSGARRGCSSLKIEKCGLHASTRRAFRVAHRGLLTETWGLGRTS